MSLSLDGHTAIGQAVIGGFFLIIEQLDQLMIRVITVGEGAKSVCTVYALGPCSAQFSIAQAVVAGGQQAAARLIRLRHVGGVQQMPAVK